MSDTPLRLVLSDVDGTLINSKKELTDETIRAVRALEDRNVLFTLTSARPPRGFAMFLDPLDLTAPLGAFNGGLIRQPRHDAHSTNSRWTKTWWVPSSTRSR